MEGFLIGANYPQSFEKCEQKKRLTRSSSSADLYWVALCPKSLPANKSEYSFTKIYIMKLSTVIPAIIIAACLFSCSSTKITSSWKAENVKTKPYRNIMVWGLLTEKDSSIRRQMEAHLVNDLISKGYRVFASTDVYKEKAYKKLTSAEILNEFKNTGIDAVITIVLLNSEKEEKYYPGGYQNIPPNSYNGNLDKYYSSTYERIFTPGYYITTTTYFWESSLFELPGAAMIYSVHTKSFDPLTTEILAHENGVQIIKDMVKKKVILDLAPKEDQ
jgi:hypothetical protein